jgi:hypothetical protein
MFGLVLTVINFGHQTVRYNKKILSNKMMKRGVLIYRKKNSPGALTHYEHDFHFSDILNSDFGILFPWM